MNWEYQLTYDPSKEVFILDCCNFGICGWEMVSAWCDERYYYAMFKRVIKST